MLALLSYEPRTAQVTGRPGQIAVCRQWLPSCHLFCKRSILFPASSDRAHIEEALPLGLISVRFGVVDNLDFAIGPSNRESIIGFGSRWIVVVVMSQLRVMRDVGIIGQKPRQTMRDEFKAADRSNIGF